MQSLCEQMLLLINKNVSQQKVFVVGLGIRYVFQNNCEKTICRRMPLKTKLIKSHQNCRIPQHVFHYNQPTISGYSAIPSTMRPCDKVEFIFSIYEILMCDKAYRSSTVTLCDPLQIAAINVIRYKTLQLKK
jgi:hypothetical protein